MTFTWRVPIGDFALTIRPGRLTTIAATLILILSAAACSATVAAPINASPAPAPGATVYGNDIHTPPLVPQSTR
jgi:hypothetical protein